MPSTPPPTREQPTLRRALVGNAFVLSVLYLVLGLGVELLRHSWPSSLLAHLSFALDALPARVLGWLGLLGPLRAAYLDGHLSERALRVAFGVTSVAFIYALAAAVGLLLWLAREAAHRVRRPPRRA